MHGDEGSAELHHLRTADSGLKPSSMVEGRVPITNGCVVFTERNFKVIIVIVTNNTALDLHIIIGGLRRKAHFSEVSHFTR